MVRFERSGPQLSVCIHIYLKLIRCEFIKENYMELLGCLIAKSPHKKNKPSWKSNLKFLQNTMAFSEFLFSSSLSYYDTC